MKRFLVTVAALATISATFANLVDQQQAVKEAQSFLSTLNAGTSHARAARVKSTSNKTFSIAEQNSAYYVVNVGTSDGFVVVSADDRAESILGYTDNGSFDAKNAPEALLDILNSYSKQMKSANVSKSSASTNKKAIAPLIKTSWQQSYIYNDQCPLYLGDETKVGCVATALAQIINYNQWPVSATTTIPAYSAHGVEVPERAAHQFAWPLTDANGKDVNINEISMLNAYVGAACQTEYGRSISKATSADGVKALIDYFGYDEQVRLINRDDYSIENWENIIYNELANNRPVYYAGVGYENGTISRSHAFICDGYNGNGLFHINFGWGGECNGYFRLQAVGSEQNDYSYSFQQEAIIGIQKPVDHYDLAEVELMKSVPNVSVKDLTVDTITYSSIYASSSQDVTIRVKNNGEEYNGNMYLFVNNNLVAAEHTPVEANTTKDVVMHFAAADYGTPEIKICGEKDGSKVIYQGTAKFYHRTYGTSIYYEVNLKDVEKKVLLGNTIKHTITITNNGYEDFANTLVMTLKDASGNKYCESLDIFVPVDETKTFSFSKENLEYGKKYNVKYECGCIVSKNYVFTPTQGVYYNTANGTQAVAAAATDGTITIPATATSVELTAETAANIVPSTNTNCLYYLAADATVPANLEGKNVVLGDYAEQISLTDAQNFTATKAFTAKKVSYSRVFNEGIEKDHDNNAWSTIILPFDVTNITIDGNEYLADGSKVTWFTGDEDEKGIFWLKSFETSEDNNLYFDYATSFNANTPYIINVPANVFGAEWNMVGKTFTFWGEDVNFGETAKNAPSKVAAREIVKFLGTTVTTTASEAYVLNEAGNSFEYQENATLDPFRAYMVITSNAAMGSDLNIASLGGNATTAIHGVINNANTNSAVISIYTTAGVQVATATPATLQSTISALPSGIYVANGKKYMNK